MVTSTPTTPTPAVAAAAAITAVAMSVLTVPMTLGQKLADTLGVDVGGKDVGQLLDTLLKPADGAGRSEIRMIILAVVALLILSAIVGAIWGIVGSMFGQRGGIERLVITMGGLIALIAVVGIIL